MVSWEEKCVFHLSREERRRGISFSFSARGDVQSECQRNPQLSFMPFSLSRCLFNPSIEKEEIGKEEEEEEKEEE